MTLSPVLYKVFKMAKRGESTKAIAEELECSYRTANHYLCGIYRKLGVNSKAQMLEVPYFLISVKDQRIDK